MTPEQQAAMKMALEALEYWVESFHYERDLRAIAALHQALEPVQMRPATREEKIVNPGVYEVKVEQQPADESVANASAWFALVMNAAAELEDASHCLRDEDAKRTAISGAKHYRDAAKALYTRPQPADTVDWRQHIEQRIRNWRQRTMNKCGDMLSIDDFMGQDSIDDLVDYVCDEWAEPKPATPVIDESAAKRIATALGWKPPVEWVGLDEKDLNKLCCTFMGQFSKIDFIKGVEAKLREKNGGKV